MSMCPFLWALGVVSIIRIRTDQATLYHVDEVVWISSIACDLHRQDLAKQWQERLRVLDRLPPQITDQALLVGRLGRLQNRIFEQSAGLVR
jgi:hypothetical protein